MSTRLRYRDPVHPKDYTRYARWVGELAGRSGVYVLRDTASRIVLYVGESHSARLRQTLTRHFQHWEGFTAGTTYDRFSVDVAVTALDLKADDVVRRQVELIRELSPSDNTHHTEPLDYEDIDSEDFRDDW